MAVNWREQVVLVTGGTGSFGRKFVDIMLRDFQPRKLIVFSRDELKQHEMQSAGFDSASVRYFIGDVRDRERLLRAMHGVDIVVHAAALKQVPACEYNPMEAVKTNIVGTSNVVEAALDAGVGKVVALSTDKAVNPINLYGATKLCSDKLFVAANNIRGSRDIRFSVVRYGNVMGSRGSVIPYFMSLRRTGALPITDASMTRFNISLQEGVDMVLWSLEHALGGEILVPKIPSYRITDVATAIAPECRQEIVGIRPGEKIHEEMITASDSFNTVDMGGYFAILPVSAGYTVAEYCELRNARPVAAGFAYNSGTNPDFLTVEQLRELIARHVACGEAVD